LSFQAPTRETLPFQAATRKTLRSAIPF
jgi:hypothetical protein